jgi:hypothetical protein
VVDSFAIDHNLPCLNPHCASHGVPHYNCRCYAAGGGEHISFASGGRVCSGPHHKDCEYYAEGGQVEEQQQIHDNPTLALDHIGANNGLLHLLTKTGSNGQSKNPHKHLEDFIDHSKKGGKSVKSHIAKLMGPEKYDMKPDKEGVSALKNHLDSLEMNPEKALDVGGHLGQTLPDHAAALGAKTANALNYFQSIKPRPSQLGPLDRVTQKDKGHEADYDRQLAIAQNPMLTLQHVKKGTIQPQDLKTLHALYPALGQSLVEKSGDALIDSQSKGVKVPYAQKQGLSELMGQPLDSTMAPGVMQLLIKANAPPQAPQPQGKSKKSGTTASTQKAIDKDVDLSATKSQELELNKKV